MKSLSLGRYALSSCVAIAFLAGCGRSQLPSGASPDAATRFDNADSQTFHYTGKEQQFKVPPGVHKINVEAWGAAGGESDVAGGNGGRVSATIPVTPGEKLFLFVGGAASGAKGGFDGGADGGISNWYPKGCQNDCAGGGGGGASDIRRDGDVLHDRIFVAGGGGGAGGDDCKYDSGSCGSGPVGGGGGRQQAVQAARASSARAAAAGVPSLKEDPAVPVVPASINATKESRARAGRRPTADPAAEGTSYGYVAGGGGGGGGYYGGGGGGGGGGWPSSGVVSGGGGGGGSSYVESSATNVHMWQGWKSATRDGLVTISWG
jgi:hypothetical protein